MLFLSKGENFRGPHSYLPIKELFFFFWSGLKLPHGL